MTQPIRSVLVANRGEIALRVFRTCRRLGIETIALYTDLDVSAPHVKAADRAIRMSSYLDIDEVVAAAVEADADAVHPGYGFLSERAPFARALAQAGVRLVGPSADVMDAMGRKDAAREIAVAADVPVVPSYALTDDPETFAYPVLVKAAAGGGGKGMRVVTSAADFAEAAAAAAREAAKSFGDDTLLVETYVESGRHLEVQILGDTHGNVIHLYERDCSTQRRHQKVIEEAPGPTIDADLRQRLTSAAVSLAKQVGYVNAGTVEFLLYNSTGDFYFFEMNTRLQFEHPVTEAITVGFDLVEEQLRITAGEPLSIGSGELGIHGHAIEARVYAEDSFGGFLPQAGVATFVRWPRGDGIRVDAALRTGQEVSTAYDPMLGKVIAHGATREDARRRLIAALDQTDIAGLTTNTGFLRALLATDEFAEATIDTAWLDHHEVAAPEPDGARALAAYALAPDSAGAPDPWRADGWRSGAPAAATLVDLDQLIEVRRDSLDSRPARILGRGRDAGGHHLAVEVNGERHEGRVRDLGATVEVLHRGQRFIFERPDAFGDHAAAVSDGTLLAPMPGTVLAVHVVEGEAVASGQTLGVLEAMKMELALKAPYHGVVAAVGAAPGEQVKLGAMLFEVSES